MSHCIYLKTLVSLYIPNNNTTYFSTHATNKQMARQAASEWKVSLNYFIFFQFLFELNLFMNSLFISKYYPFAIMLLFSDEKIVKMSLPPFSLVLLLLLPNKMVEATGELTSESFVYSREFRAIMGQSH